MILGLELKAKVTNAFEVIPWTRDRELAGLA